MALSTRKPAVRFMLTCQRIIKEEGTGAISLIAIFRDVNTKSVPVPIEPLHLFAALTDAQGEYEFKLEIVRVKDQATVSEIKLPMVTIANPTDNGELVLQIGGLSASEPGTYDIRLWANGLFLDHTEITVRLVQ